MQKLGYELDSVSDEFSKCNVQRAIKYDNHYISVKTFGEVNVEVMSCVDKYGDEENSDLDISAVSIIFPHDIEDEYGTYHISFSYRLKNREIVSNLSEIPLTEIVNILVDNGISVRELDNLTRLVYAAEILNP